jgi:hypothetical protein
MVISVDSGRNKLSEVSGSTMPVVHRYRRHEPEKTVLYPIIVQHPASLTDELTRHHAALPTLLTTSFLTFRYVSGCPTCSGRAYPWPLRLLFASRPDALSRCLAVITRAIENAPDQQHLEKLLNHIIARVMRRLIKDGLLIQDQDQPWLDLQETDTLDTFNAASTRYRVALGPGAAGRTLTLKNPGLQRPNSQPKPFTMDRDGFSLNAAVSCQPYQRQRLERLCRYVTRRPSA